MHVRLLGYIAAIVMGIVGIVSGLNSHSGLVLGVAIGWLIASFILIIRHEASGFASIDDGLFAIFDIREPIVGVICVAIMAASGIITSLLYH